MKLIDECIENLNGVIERLELEFPLIYSQSQTLTISFPPNKENDWMKLMILPELKKVSTTLAKIQAEVITN